uniref:EGF-like domain-containing protein n=1 Tax=Biomphalaria glabrata TaxID=6526 RepID=A0A2C9MA36_BIOGL
MRRIVILFALVGTFTWPFVATQGNTYCRPSDFCSYKCHCSSCGPNNGLCAVNATCVKGWFGHNCQYQDLKPDQVEIEAQQSKPQWLMDNNDATCNKGASIGSVTMTLDDDYPLTWIRIVLNDTAMFSTVKLFYSETEECQKTTWSRPNERTMDIRCEKSVLIRTLKIIGNLDSLCSLYINGGRNVAYGQRASQTSNFSNNIYLANSAVDGDYITFSHTGAEERPRFSLTFNTNYLVTRFLLYNRGKNVHQENGVSLVQEIAVIHVLPVAIETTERVMLFVLDLVTHQNVLKRTTQLTIIIIWRRKRTPNYKKEFQDNGHHNIVVLDNVKDEQYTLTPKKIRISEVDKEQSNPYIELPEDFAADTMMAVGSLNTYMKSKDAEFYKKQFEVLHNING